MRARTAKIAMGLLVLMSAAGCELIAGLGDHELASGNGSGDGSIDGASGEAAAPGFSLTAEPTLTLLPGANAPLAITVTRTGGYSDVVNLTASGLPPTATSNTASVTSDTTTGSLTISIAASAAQSLTHMTINGVSGDGKINASAPLDLLVRGPAGSVDDTFGTQGVVTGFTSGVGVFADFIALDPKQNIVIAGGDGTHFSIETDMLRLTPNGAPDPTFADGGLLAQIFFQEPDTIEGLEMLDAGAWKIAGNAGTLSPPYDIFFAHVNENGTYDTAYGNGEAGAFYDLAYESQIFRFAFDPSGLVYAAGSTQDATPKLHLERRLASGAPDSTFNAADQTFGTGGVGGVGTILVQSDGKPVVVMSVNDASGFGIGLVRYTTTGAIDTTYGVSGYVAPESQTLSSFGALASALQPDGKVLSVGCSNTSCFLARFTSTGGLDEFGDTNFTATLPASVASIALQPDGKILVSYSPNISTDGGYITGIGLLRLTSGGLGDATFGNGGSVVLPLSGGAGGPGALAGPMAVQADGRILMAATESTSGLTSDYTILRFWP